MKSLRLRLCLAGALLLSALMPNAASSNAATVPPQAVPDIFALIHDGEELTFAQFRQRAGDELAKKFERIQPVSVRRAGNRFFLKTVPTVHSRYGCTVYVGADVSLHAVKSGRVLTVTEVTGVEIFVFGKRSKVKEVVVTPLEGTRVHLSGKLEVSRFLPYIPLSITIDKNKVHDTDADPDDEVVQEK